MIYPRLKNKSEVFANILDGKTHGEFRIENDTNKFQNKNNQN